MPTYQLIQQFRRERKITQRELAERLRLLNLKGFAASDVSKVERGVRVVKSDEVPMFATALDCSIEDLHDAKPLPKW